MVFFEDNIFALRLCFVVEKVLHFGLNSISIFSTTTPWDYLQHLPRCLPDGSNIVEWSKSSYKTAIGRTRIFIRIALNENALSDYLGALAWNQEITRSVSFVSSTLGD